MPYLKTNIILIMLLISLEVIKELPITLILRPFNFETLATYTYQFAHDELMIEASLPAFFIIITGLIPILLLQNQLNSFFHSKNWMARNKRIENIKIYNNIIFTLLLEPINCSFSKVFLCSLRVCLALFGLGFCKSLLA